MRLHKRLVYSFVIALIIFFLSLGVSIIPCQTAPAVPNPQYSWTTCTLNPDIIIQSPIHKSYLGLTPHLTQAYILVIGVVFIIAFIILSLVLRPKKQ